jgi:hypothetical protein
MKKSLALAVFLAMSCAFNTAQAASDHLTKRCGLVCQAKCAAKRAACLDACVSNPVPNPSQCVTNCTDEWRMYELIAVLDAVSLGEFFNSPPEASSIGFRKPNE